MAVGTAAPGDPRPEVIDQLRISLWDLEGPREAENAGEKGNCWAH